MKKRISSKVLRDFITIGGAIFTLSQTTFAQTMPHDGPQIFGLMDISIGRAIPAGGLTPSKPATTGVVGGGMSTSFWGVRGRESIGAGTAAIFELSSFIRNESGAAGRNDAIPSLALVADPYFSRSAWVGISDDGWGQVRAGNITSLLFVNSIVSNAFGDSVKFSPTNVLTFIASPLSGGTGWANSLAYDSPLIKGFGFSGAHALPQGQGGSNSAIRLHYTADALSTSLVWQRVRRSPTSFADGTSSDKTNAWQIAGSYNLQNVTVYGHLGNIQVQEASNANNVDRYKTWDFGMAMPIGMGRLLASYGSRSISDKVAAVPAFASGGNVSRRIWSLGYDHVLSRRTDLYAVLMKDLTQTNTLNSSSTAAAGVSGLSGAGFSIGIRHSF